MHKMNEVNDIPLEMLGVAGSYFVLFLLCYFRADLGFILSVFVTSVLWYVAYDVITTMK